MSETPKQTRSRHDEANKSLAQMLVYQWTRGSLHFHQERKELYEFGFYFSAQSLPSLGSKAKYSRIYLDADVYELMVAADYLEERGYAEAPEGMRRAYQEFLENPRDNIVTIEIEMTDQQLQAMMKKHLGIC